jgi:hypothetical protein
MAGHIKSKHKLMKKKEKKQLTICEFINNSKVIVSIMFIYIWIISCNNNNLCIDIFKLMYFINIHI